MSIKTSNDEWTINYEDNLLLDYFEKEANQHQMIATENITKIWDEIETKILICSKNVKTTGNNVTINSSPTPSYGLQLFPQEYNLFDFNMTHYKIMKSVHTTFHDVYDIFTMFTSSDFTNLELMINNIYEVSHHMQIYQRRIESNISKKDIHQIKTNYKAKYGYIQNLIQVTSIQKRINIELLTRVKFRLSSIERKNNDFVAKIQTQRLLYEILSLLQFENTTIIQLSNFLTNFQIAYIKQENNTIEPKQKSQSQSQLESQLESKKEKNIESNVNKRKERNISTTSTTATTTTTSTTSTTATTATTATTTTTTIKPIKRSIKRSKQPKIVEVVRNKEERKSLIGHSCPQCIDFYENVFGKDTEECREAIQLCSRHRTRYTPPPGTPPGFWDLDIQTPEEWKLQDEEMAKRQEEKAYEENKESKEKTAKESQQSQQSQQSQDTLLE